MANRKYLSLPFEIHYRSIPYTSYEQLVHSSEISGKKAKKGKYKNVGVEITRGASIGTVFRCDENASGELAYTLDARLELAPDWLRLVSDGDLAINEASRHPYVLDDDGFVIEMPLGDPDDYECTGTALAYYDCENGEVECIVLDPDGDRVRIDREGYRLADDGTREGRKPFLTIAEEDLEECELVSKEWCDVGYELRTLFD